MHLVKNNIKMLTDKGMAVPSRVDNEALYVDKQADDPKEAAKGILKRAAARGVISGVVATTSTSSHQPPSSNLEHTG